MATRTTWVPRQESNRIEDAIGASKNTRLLVCGLSLSAVFGVSCALLLVTSSQDSGTDCGEQPDWGVHVEPSKRMDLCTGKRCQKTQCGHVSVNNDSCQGVVRPYADRCRCCEACVLQLEKDADCSNRPSDLRDVRECGPGLYCNHMLCRCMQYTGTP
ncbi:uncharacterized protein LOC144132464 isoform X2 [Amblyomma americanum]